MSYIRLSPQDLGVTDEADLLHLAELLPFIENRACLLKTDSMSNEISMITVQGALTLRVDKDGLEIESGPFPSLTGNPCPFCNSLMNFSGEDYWHCGECGTHSQRQGTGETKQAALGPTEHILQFRGVTACRVVKEEYANNHRVALSLYDVVTQELVLTATTNVPEMALLPDRVIIKNWSENEGILEALQKAKVIGPVEQVVKLGYADGHICKLLI